MSLSIIAVLFSAFSHPFVAVFAKRAAHPFTINFLGIILACMGFSYIYFQPSFWHNFFLHWEIIFLSGFLHFIYVALSLLLIKKHDFQVLYPLTRIAPIFIIIGEIFILGNEFLWMQILGIIFITIGALIFGLDKNLNGFRTSILFQIFIITLCVAGFFILDKKILEFYSPAEQWAVIFIQIPLMGFLILNKKKELLQDFKNIKNTLSFTLCMVITWYLALYALQNLDSSVVASVRNLSILFGVFLGAHLFDEGHKILRYLAALLICTGIFLILF